MTITLSYWSLVGIGIVFLILGYVIGQIDYKRQIKKERKRK